MIFYLVLFVHNFEHNAETAIILRKSLGKVSPKGLIQSAFTSSYKGKERKRMVIVKEEVLKL